MNRNFVLILVFVVNILSRSFSQSAEIDRYFIGISGGNNPAVPESFFLQKNEQRVQKALLHYCADTFLMVRKNAFLLLASQGLKSGQAETRRKTVTALLAGYNDVNAGIRNICRRKLLLFFQDDFDNAAHDSVCMMLRKSGHPGKYLLLLAGLTGNINTIAEIKTLWNNGTLTPEEKWYALISLVRCGEKTYEDLLLGSVKILTVNDDFVYEVLPGLLFSCSRNIYDYLFSLVFEGKTYCSCGNPDSESLVLCSLKILNDLSEHVEGFPVERDNGGGLMGSRREIMEKTDEWFAENKSAYRIIKKGFK